MNLQSALKYGIAIASIVAISMLIIAVVASPQDSPLAEISEIQQSDEEPHHSHDHEYDEQRDLNSSTNYYLADKDIQDFFIKGENVNGLKVEISYTDGSKKEHEIIAGESLGDESHMHDDSVSNLIIAEKEISEVKLLHPQGENFELETLETAQRLTENQLIDTSSSTSYYRNKMLEQQFENMGLDIITREEWGAPATSTWNPSMVNQVDKIVIHHTATSVDHSNPANTVRRIYDYHRMRCANNSGSYNPNDPNCNETHELWQDIGYNYLIDHKGNIYQGRAGTNGAVAAHSPPNSGTIGIGMIGYFVDDIPSSAARASLRELLGRLTDLNDLELKWGDTVVGHRDRNPTACPGKEFYDLMETLVYYARKNYSKPSRLAAAQNHEERLLNVKNESLYQIGSYVQMLADPTSMGDNLENYIQNYPGVRNYRETATEITFEIHTSRLRNLLREAELANPSSHMQPNYIYRLKAWASDGTRANPNDYDPIVQWHHEKTKLPEAWERLGGCQSDNSCGGDPNVKVAIIDTGIAYENFDFDAGGSYQRRLFSGEGFTNLAIEVPTSGSNGIYNEGYDRRYAIAPELNAANFTAQGYDAVQDTFCDMRAGTSYACNAAELAKINHANDDHSHGTAVASVIAANVDNATDGSDPLDNNLAGAAHNVTIMPIKAFLPNDSSMCYTFNGSFDANCDDVNGIDLRTVSTTAILTRSVDYAVAQEADIINMSLGGGGYDPILQGSINNAHQNEIVVVAASGNSNEDIDEFNNFPGSYENVVVVGAVDEDNGKSSYSNFGDAVDIVAPVGPVGSIDPGVPVQAFECSQTDTCWLEDDDYYLDNADFTDTGTPINYRGTSFAAPQVAASLALAKSQNQTAQAEDLINLLEQTATDIGATGKDEQTGHGLLNTHDLVSASSTPVIDLLTPSTNQTVDLSYDSVSWNVDSLNYSVKVYVDNDNTGFDGEEIYDCGGEYEAGGTNSCELNTRSLLNGQYYLYACATNSLQETSCDYAPGRLDIAHTEKIETGIELIDHNLKEISFDTSFDVPPYVFAEIASEEGPDTVFAQVQNVTTTGFSVRLVENDKVGWDSEHTKEILNWKAIQSSTDEILVGSISTDHNSTTIPFSTSFASTPSIDLQQQTVNGRDYSQAEVTNVGQNGISARIEEFSGFDGRHLSEEIAWLAYTTSASLGQSGQASTDHNWNTVTFPTPFSQVPLIFAEISTENGPDAAFVDIRDVTTQGFQFRIEEDPKGLDVEHAVETIDWLAIEYNNYPEFEYAKLSIDHNSRFTYFDKVFGNTPTFLSEINSENGPDTALIDVLEVNRLGFELRVEEDRVAGWDDRHTQETVSWLAIDQLAGTHSGRLQTDEQWTSANFNHTFGSLPFAFAQIISENGQDTARLDIRDLTTSGMQVRVEEDVVAGWDGRHLDESINWLTFESARFGGQAGRATIDHNNVNINFSSAFSSNPLIFAEIVTENGSDTVQVDISNVTTTGFTIRLEEDKLSYGDGRHLPEEIVWWAFE